MSLPSLQQLEHSLGGRPRNTKETGPKIRLSIYLSQGEADQLKILAQSEDQSISHVTRRLIKQALERNTST